MKDFLQTGGLQSANEAGEMATRIMKGPHLPLPTPPVLGRASHWLWQEGDGERGTATGGCCRSQGRKEGLTWDPELPRPLLSPPSWWCVPELKVAVDRDESW